MRRTGAAVLLGGLLAALAVQPADARVARLVVGRTAPYAGGKSFGEAGPFERLDGTVYLEVDPDDPLNAVIVNLDRAPRNARGLVEFSAPFFIIKPVDLARGNGKLLYGVNNRGNAIELGFQTFPSLPAGADPESGDGLFFRLGYSFVDAGWAGDVLTTRRAWGPTCRSPCRPTAAPSFRTSASSIRRTRCASRWAGAAAPTRCRSRATTASSATRPPTPIRRTPP